MIETIMNNNTLYQLTLSHLQQIINTYIESTKAKRGISWDAAHWIESKTICWALGPKFNRAEVLDALENLGYKKKRLRVYQGLKLGKRKTTYVSPNWAKWNKCSEWNQIGFWH